MPDEHPMIEIRVTPRPGGWKPGEQEEFIGRSIDWDLTMYARAGFGLMWRDLLAEQHGESIATLAEANLYEAGEGLSALSS